MREKRTRVLVILVIMMMVFALMPVQTVWADYKNGDTCPYCHSGILVLMGVSDTTHYFQCNNTECIYRNGYFLVEDHWGGVATCTEVARCKGCMDTQNMEGTPYGELDPNNHTGTSTVIGKKAATCTEAGYTGDKKWSCCDKEIEKGETIAALGHSWGEWKVTKEATTTEEGVETRVCKNDSTHTETRKIAKKEETKEEETEKKEETKKEAAKAETVSKTTDTQPQTGDESQTVWVIMMMLSAAVLIVLAVRKRRVFD